MRRVHGVVAVWLAVAGLVVGSGWLRGPGLAAAVPAAGQWNLDIERAMDAAGVAPGLIVGEAGAGDGYFTLPMARRVGAAGAVYANDINRRSLDELASRAKQANLANVHTVEGSVDDARFPRRDLQLVVVVHAFHDFDQPAEWLVNLKQYLRPGATVAIIDRDPDQGAPSHFWTRERILGHAARAGYDPVKVVTDISEHLIVVLKPR